MSPPAGSPSPLRSFRLADVSAFRVALAGAAVFTAACGSIPPGGGEVIALPGGVPTAVDGAVAAAMACGFQVHDAAADPGRTRAVLVLLTDWRNPRPESALVTLDLRAGPGGVEVRIEAHPLAEYGMRIPEVSAGAGAPSCLPCAASAAAFKEYQYSPSLATGNAHRARRCIREALTGSAP